MGQGDSEDKVRLMGWARALYAAESRRAVLWLPVALGAGAWLYFALPAEPAAAWALAPLAPLALLATGLPRRAGALALALALVAAAAATGFAAGVIHARAAAGPILAAPVTATVEGRVLGLSRAASGAPRVLLGGLVVHGLDPAETPARGRIALIETDRAAAPAPGARIRVHARLFPPGGAVEPGAYDFRRQAYFDGLGAVGYAVGPVLTLPGRAGGPAAALAGLRESIAEGLRARLPGPEGAFAAAIVVGDRSAIEEAEAEALRAANLAHLLAISGLHMGILCGLVFGALRLGLAAVPALALSLPVKKIAAAGALLAGLGYLALSGATVPTQRAFVMAAVALVAVLLDRPALTLRALALAAAIVLLLRPVSLFEPGFQMSFAATAALVAGFEALGRRAEPPPGRGLRRRLARRVAVYAVGLAVTSVVAGLATAPFAALAFNRVPVWGLPANLAAVPVMGLWVAPMAALAGLAAPLGFAGPFVAAMGAGIGLILEVARAVADWPGAVRMVPAAPAGVAPLVVLGGLWLLLWRSPLRLAGLPALLAAALLWHEAPPRPDVLVAPGARLVGVPGPEGRVLDHDRVQGFAAGIWLARDGDPADQAQAAARPGLTRHGGWTEAALPHGWRLARVQGRRADAALLSGLCVPRTVLVLRPGTPHGLRGAGAPACLLIDGAAGELDGALALWIGPAGPRIAQAQATGRLWQAARTGGAGDEAATTAD